MKSFRMFRMIVRRCHLDKLLVTFFICFFAGAALIWLAEPSVHTYREALWYTFVACTSIGFGDYVAVTFIGRTVTVFMTIMEIILVAMMSGVVVSHYLEVVQRREQLTVTQFIDKLSHITELTREELQDLEADIREYVE